MTGASPSTDILDPDVSAAGIPLDAYRHLRDTAPVSWQQTRDGRGYWLLTRHQTVREVAVDASTYSSYRAAVTPPGSPSEPIARDLVDRLMLTDMDPPTHGRYRRIITRSFAVSAVQRLEQRVRQIADEILDRVIERGECDFARDVAGELPMHVIAELLGLPPGDHGYLSRLCNACVGADDPDYSGSQENTLRAMRELCDYSQRIGDERRVRPRDDLLSALVSAEVDGRTLTPDEVGAFFLLLVIAGNETTHNLIAGGLQALFEHPAAHARLQRDRALLPLAVEEMLRYVSPILQFRRIANQDVTLHGQTIREGDRVVLSFASANYDERVFLAPERFDITRQPNLHLAFGFGPHLCLGATLARLETRVLFDALLTRVPDITSGGPARRQRSNLVNGIKSMPVRFTSGPRLAA